MLSQSALRYLTAPGGAANFLSVAHDLHHALSFVVRAGVLERLAVAPRALAELARELGLHPAPLGVVLDALSHFGIVRRGPDGYELDDEGRVLLPAASDQARHALLLAGQVPLAALAIEGVLHSGTSGVELAYGASLYRLAERSPPLHRALYDLCESFYSAGGMGPVVAATIAGAGHRRVVDLGGGHGRLIGEVLQRDPACHGVVFDLPHAIAAHRARLALVDRLSIVEGDFFASVPAADAYVVCNVLFNWPDERVLALLRNVCAVCEPGAALYVADLFQDGSFECAFLNLDELLTTGGGCRTRQAMVELLAQGGFVVETVDEKRAPFQLLVARRVS